MLREFPPLSSITRKKEALAAFSSEKGSSKGRKKSSGKKEQTFQEQLATLQERMPELVEELAPESEEPESGPRPSQRGEALEEPVLLADEDVELLDEEPESGPRKSGRFIDSEDPLPEDIAATVAAWSPHTPEGEAAMKKAAEEEAARQKAAEAEATKKAAEEAMMKTAEEEKEAKRAVASLERQRSEQVEAQLVSRVKKKLIKTRNAYPEYLQWQFGLSYSEAHRVLSTLHKQGFLREMDDGTLRIFPEAENGKSYPVLLPEDVEARRGAVALPRSEAPGIDESQLVEETKKRKIILGQPRLTRTLGADVVRELTGDTRGRRPTPVSPPPDIQVTPPRLDVEEESPVPVPPKARKRRAPGEPLEKPEAPTKWHPYKYIPPPPSVVRAARQAAEAWHAPSPEKADVAATSDDASSAPVSDIEGLRRRYLDQETEEEEPEMVDVEAVQARIARIQQDLSALPDDPGYTAERRHLEDQEHKAWAILQGEEWRQELLYAQRAVDETEATKAQADAVAAEAEQKAAKARQEQEAAAHRLKEAQERLQALDASATPDAIAVAGEIAALRKQIPDLQTQADAHDVALRQREEEWKPLAAAQKKATGEYRGALTWEQRLRENLGGLDTYLAGAAMAGLALEGMREDSVAVKEGAAADQARLREARLKQEEEARAEREKEEARQRSLKWQVVRKSWAGTKWTAKWTTGLAGLALAGAFMAGGALLRHAFAFIADPFGTMKKIANWVTKHATRLMGEGGDGGKSQPQGG